MSDSDKQALLNNTAVIPSKIEIILEDNDNIVLTESNGIINWNYEDFRYVPNEGFIGQFVERQVNGEIKNISNTFDITDKEIEVSFCVKVGNSENWYSLGNFIVSKVTDNEVLDKTTFEAKDYTKKFNKTYEDTITYPCTALQLAQNVCNQCGVVFGSQSFKNSNYIINGNVFVNGETCRDVMKAIGKLAFSWVRVDWDNKVYIDFTKETVVDTYNKASNSKYYTLKTQKEQFGPVNRITIGYSQIEGEKTKIEDTESIEENGLCELNIYDNPLVYTQAQRESIINSASDLLGLYYMPSNFETVGHAWLKGKELFEITDMEGNTHNTIPFDRTIKYFGHIKTLINVPTPTKTESSLAYTPQIKDKVGRTEIIVDKMNQTIQSIIENTTYVSDTKTGTGSVTLENAHEGQLYQLNIKGQISLLFPQSEDNLYGYPLVPSDDLVPSDTLVPSSPVPYGNHIPYPSELLYPKSSKLIIDNKEYKLDFDFLNYINDDVCDEFIYENGTCYIIRRVGIDSQGEKYALDNEVIEPRKGITLNVKSNSTISLKSFSEAKLSITYLLKNVYTDNFATEVEMKSEMKQTEDQIMLEVSEKVDNENYTKAEIVARINDNTSQVKINAGEVDIEANDVLDILAGNTINLTSKEIAIDSTNFKVDKNGNVTANNMTANDIDIKSGNIELIAPVSTPLEPQDAKLILKSSNNNERYKNELFSNGMNITAPANNDQSIFRILAVNSVAPGHELDSNVIVQLFDEFDSLTPSIELDSLSGTITCVAVEQTSLESEKRDFEKLNSGLDIIKNIDIYKYHLKSQKEDDKKHIGFVIGDNFKYSQEITSNDNDRVDIYSFVSVCCKAIQEQQEQINSLKEEIKKLKESDK